MGFIGWISPKGQITIPAEARKKLGLEPGRKVNIEVSGDEVHIKAKKRGAHGLKGIFSKPNHRIDDDREIMTSVWEKTKPGKRK